MPESSKRRRTGPIALLLVALLIVLGTAGWWLRSRTDASAAGRMRASAPQAAATTPATNPAAAPPLQGVYYIGGHVPRAGAYAFNGQPVTVKQALAAAGLPASAKGLSYVTISRTTPEGPELVKIDPAALFGRGEQDEPLRADDKILVTAGPH